MKHEKRWYIADLIREYLERQHLTHAEVSARDIIKFHGLPSTLSISIGVVLKQIFWSNAKSTKYGFFVIDRRTSKSTKQPNRYTVLLMESV